MKTLSKTNETGKSPTKVAVLAVQAAELMAGEAAERQRSGKSADGSGGGRGHTKPYSPKEGKVKREPETVAKAAKAAGAGQNQVEAMKVVKAKAPEIFKAVQAGEIRTVADAMIAEPQAEQPAKATSLAIGETLAAPGITPTAAEMAPLASIPAPGVVETAAPVVAEVGTIELAPPNLADLEQVIASGLRTFVDVGQALTRIRDGELYKATHTSFEAYCAERWDMRRTYAHYLIESAAVVHNCEHAKLSPPTKEAHARELAKLPPKEQPRAWAAAVKTAPDGLVTARHVAAIVASRLPEPAPKAPPKPRLVRPQAPASTTPTPIVRRPSVTPLAEATKLVTRDRARARLATALARSMKEFGASNLIAGRAMGVSKRTVGLWVDRESAISVEAILCSPELWRAFMGHLGCILDEKEEASND